jgi:hypothetical protein
VRRIEPREHRARPAYGHGDRLRLGLKLAPGPRLRRRHGRASSVRSLDVGSLEPERDDARLDLRDLDADRRD